MPSAIGAGARSPTAPPLPAPFSRRSPNLSPSRINCTFRLPHARFTTSIVRWTDCFPSLTKWSLVRALVVNSSMVKLAAVALAPRLRLSRHSPRVSSRRSQSCKCGQLLVGQAHLDGLWLAAANRGGGGGGGRSGADRRALGQPPPPDNGR